MARSTFFQQRLHRVAEVAEHSLAMRKLQGLFPDALTVTDATQERFLLVTVDDVAKGQQRDPSACAVAQCANRQGLGGMIGRSFAYLIDGTQVTRYQLGKDAQMRTAVFDLRGTMEPGPVLLSVPSPHNQLGHIKQRAATSATVTKRKKRSKAKLDKARRQIAKRQGETEEMRRVVATHGFRTWQHVPGPGKKAGT